METCTRRIKNVMLVFFLKCWQKIFMILHENHGDTISPFVDFILLSGYLLSRPGHRFAVPACLRTCTLALSCVPTTGQLHFISVCPSSIAAGHNQPLSQSVESSHSIKENKVRLIISNALLHLTLSWIRNTPKENSRTYSLCEGRVNYTGSFSELWTLTGVFKLTNHGNSGHVE